MSTQTDRGGTVIARIDGVTHDGQGVARLDGKAVFVPGALPGETVRLTVVDQRRRWARGRLDAVIEAAPERTDPPCPYASACGGCDLQHVTPEGQRALKTRIVREQLARLGGLADPPVVDCLAVSPATGYRNRAVLHAAANGRLGFHRRGSHEVVPVDRCLVLTADAQAVREAVGDTTGAAQVAIRAHGSTAAAVLTPGPGPLTLPASPDRLLLSQPDGSTLCVRGEDELTEEVAGHRFSFTTSAFFQGNTDGAEVLVERVLAAVGDVAGLGVWDLYAGVGLLSLPLAAVGAEVLAVEGHGPAADAARANATAAGLDLQVRHEPVGRLLAQARKGDPGLDPPDVVVLDPPRTGAGTEVVSDLLALRPPTLVYVACDVAALARDTRALVAGGYELLRAEPLDLFPMTHHVEVVARFRPVRG